MPLVPQEDVLSALVAMMRDQLSQPVGDGAPPEEEPPYFYVNSIPGGSYVGPPLVNPEADMAMVVQVTSIGFQRDQTQQLATLARKLILGRDASGAFQASIAGGTFVVVDRWPDSGPPGVDYSGRPPDRLFNVAERFVLYTRSA